MGDVGQLVVAPRRQDMGVQQSGVAVVGAGLPVWASSQRSAHWATVTRPRSGAVQVRVTIADVASSSQRWASTLRRKAPLVLPAAQVPVPSSVTERAVADPNAADGAIHSDLRRDERCCSMQEASDTRRCQLAS